MMIASTSPRSQFRSAKDVYNEVVTSQRRDISGRVRYLCRGANLPTDCDDMVQEVFTRGWEALISGKFANISLHPDHIDEVTIELRKWMFVTAGLVVLEQLSKSRRRQRIDHRRKPSDEAKCPSDSAMVELHDAIGKCSPSEQVVAVLLLKGFNLQKIAADLRISRSTAYRRLEATKRRLRHLLG